MELPPREYNVDRQVCVIESRVPRTLFGMSPPNAAMQDANALDDISTNLALSPRVQIGRAHV